MKKFIYLTFLAAIIFFAMSARPTDKAMLKKTEATFSVTIANGTNWYGYCDIGGTHTPLSPTSSAVANVYSGFYTVTLHTDSPGSHQYLFTGQTTVVNSTGTVIFNNVHITGNSNAAIY